MFTTKKNYYLYIDNTKVLDLNLIKKRGKFNIILRNSKKKEEYSKINKFRKQCSRKGIKFFIANNKRLAILHKADGLYISSYNKMRLFNSNFSKNMQLIGSAHNQREIYQKINQGCKSIILSRVFKTDYINKIGFLGVVKFNNFIQKNKVILVPLGGIRINNLNKLKMIKTSSLAILSEIKKKPAILNRLF